MSFWNKKTLATPTKEASASATTVQTVAKPQVLQPMPSAAAASANLKTVPASAPNIAAGPTLQKGEAPKAASSPSAAVVESVAPPTKTLSIDDSLVERFGKVRSALGVGTVIQGKLSFDMPVRIDGKLTGEVFSSRAIIVGPKGSVSARVEVAALIVQGSVKGTIRASERIEVYAGACVEGALEAPVIMVQEGAKIDGSCSINPRVKESAKLAVIDAPPMPKKAEPALASTNAAASTPATTSSSAPSVSASGGTRAATDAEARLH